MYLADWIALSFYGGVKRANAWSGLRYRTPLRTSVLAPEHSICIMKADAEREGQFHNDRLFEYFVNEFDTVAACVRTWPISA